MAKLVERQTSSGSQPIAAFGDDKREGTSPRILVVEDDFLIGMEIEASLQIAGYVVIGVAGSVEQALALAARQRPDLAIVDVRLHGPRDGIEAATILFSEYGVRSVFATAHADDLVRSRAAVAQPLGWLQKPYTMPLLVETVGGALAQLQQGP